MPPLTGTVKSCVYLPVKTARAEVNITADPSGVKLCATSGPGCQVSLVGTPPVTGTT